VRLPFSILFSLSFKHAYVHQLKEYTATAPMSTEISIYNNVDAMIMIDHLVNFLIVAKQIIPTTLRLTLAQSQVWTTSQVKDGSGVVEDEWRVH